MYEWIQVKATLHAIDNTQYQCQKCLSRFDGVKNQEQQTLKMKQTKACEEIAPTPRHYIGDLEKPRQLKFTLCPGNYFSLEVAQYVGWHQHFENGILPFPGSLGDQPNKVIELFNVIALYKQDKMKAEIQKQKSQAGRNGG